LINVPALLFLSCLLLSSVIIIILIIIFLTLALPPFPALPVIWFGCWYLFKRFVLLFCPCCPCTKA